LADKITFKFDRNALNTIEAFIDQKYRVRVGILSNQWDKKPDEPWERKIGPVELAMVHEFGSQKRKIPQRSFFRKAMADRKGEFKKLIHAKRASIGQRIAEGQGLSVLDDMGAQWVDYVLDCFDRQGPGWQSLAASTLRKRRKVFNKKTKKLEPSHKILWVTGALATSIDYEISGA
jgi:hypothetical protein